ncbi:MAG: beta-ketoacyl-[acyl-carrier-protein] synthase family protein [Lentisphaerae bacterium]|nr:beta-ketoacyl-[acyl-carrier-protein] synthase family protein [Lentisphaerota bacterium]
MNKPDKERVVITGVGLTAPNGNSLGEFRQNLLNGVSGVKAFETRYFGPTIAGICSFDPLKYQKRKELRIGTRAGSISIYCVHEALADAGIRIGQDITSDRAGVFIGLTEHGNVETENEIYEISKYGYQTKYWSHYHNPRTVANNPAGEVTVNVGITGPHYTIGAACAAGNLGCVNGVQQILLGEVDVALAGGVSESPGTFGIFAAFNSQNALAHHDDPTKASRPFDKTRNGIVVSEGGAIYVLERLDRAKARGAKIYGEVTGYSYNSDATDMVLPNPVRQAACMRQAIERAGLTPADIHIVNTHATGTPAGDIKECEALRDVFGENCPDTYFNNTKSFIGHCMGAAAALELAGNLASFQDHIVHPTINVDELDPLCMLNNLVLNTPTTVGRVDSILNNSFGMLGINCVLVLSKFA